MNDLIKIPRGFYDDHVGRDLPAPRAVRSTKRHVWIYKDDADLAELRNDAEYYADPAGFDLDTIRRVVPGARALLKALNSED